MLEGEIKAGMCFSFHCPLYSIGWISWSALYFVEGIMFILFFRAIWVC